MVDFVTSYESFQEEEESSVVLVTYRSIALFDPDSPQIPSRVELEEALFIAFQGVALDGYLGMVQALPVSNLFTTTTEIFLLQSSPPGSESGGGVSGAAILATSVGLVLASALAAFSLYRRRRQRRRRIASDRFMKDVGELDSSFSGRTMSQSNEELSSIYGIEELERIEVCLCESEVQIDDLRRLVPEETPSGLFFVQEMNFIFQDEKSKNDDSLVTDVDLSETSRSDHGRESINGVESFEDSNYFSDGSGNSDNDSGVEGTLSFDIDE